MAAIAKYDRCESLRILGRGWHTIGKDNGILGG